MSTRKVEILQLWPQWQTFLFSSRARPIRFIITGGIAACVQLGFLHILTNYNVLPIVANAVAFLLSAQVNFLLSCLFTWQDRQPLSSTKYALLRRWITFHGSVASTAILNTLVFAIAHQFVPTLLASATGIFVAAFVNFFMMNKLIFRVKHEKVLIEVGTPKIPVALNAQGE